MTPKEELGQFASALSGVELFLARIGRHRLLSAAEEVALAKRVEHGDLTAKQQMISANLRLVVSIGKRYRGRGVPFLARVSPGRRMASGVCVLRRIRGEDGHEWLVLRVLAR